jgi:hypothetical protein
MGVAEAVRINGSRDGDNAAEAIEKAAPNHGASTRWRVDRQLRSVADILTLLDGVEAIKAPDI